DEAVFGVTALEPAYGVDGETGALALLEIAGADSRLVGHAFRRGQPGFEGRHVLRSLLQRIARRNQPPHLIQPERAERLQADVAAPAVGGVERAAEETDARPKPQLA